MPSTAWLTEGSPELCLNPEGWYDLIGALPGRAQCFVKEAEMVDDSLRAGWSSLVEPRDRLASPRMSKVRAERGGDVLVLEWGTNSTRVELSLLQEIWVVRVGDSFAGPNEQALFLVEAASFVGVVATTPGLIASLRPEIERLIAARHLHCADTDRLPRAWQIGMGVFPTANVKPTRRDRTELEQAKTAWHVLACAPTIEEIFT